MSVKIGGAEGGNFTKKKQWKIKDGDNTYRILPSLGFNGKEPDGKWAKFYNVHFGYKNSAGKLRVFQSPLVKNRDTKMIEKPDAALERIEKLKAELEKAKESKNKAMYDKLLPLVGGNKPLYNMDNNHHVNAINEQGEIGVLRIRHTAKKALDAVITALRAKGIEPLGVEQGRFFVINRVGMGRDTTFTVTVKTRTLKIDGVGEVNQDIVHVLTPEIIARLETEAGDLDNLYRRLSSEEVARLVKESELLTGKSPVVDELFDKKGQAAAADADPEDAEDGEAGNPARPDPAGLEGRPAANAGPAAYFQAPAPTPAPQAAPVAQPNQTVTAAAQTTTIKLDTPTAPAATVSPSEMSDEDFLKSLEG